MKFLLFSILFCSHWGLAQSYDADMERKGFHQLTQSGKLLNLTVVPQGKEVRLELAGKPAMTMRLEAGMIEATYGLGGKRQPLQIVKTKDPKTGQEYFSFNRPNTPISDLKINVKTEKGQEQFVIPRLD